jgi:hypothetical protein
MSESDTPRSKQWLRGYYDNDATLDAYQVMQELERELADMTKQRDHYKAACNQYSEDEMLCKLQEVAEQRDALAVALQEIKDMCIDKTIELHSDDDCKGMIDDLLVIAEQALAVTKK